MVRLQQHGVFDASERAFAGRALVAGANELELSLPQATAGGELFARFRFTSTGIASPDGVAADGEVEDYVIAVDGGAILAKFGQSIRRRR